LPESVVIEDKAGALQVALLKGVSEPLYGFTPIPANEIYGSAPKPDVLRTLLGGPEPQFKTSITGTTF
jgi:hypothetical protein